MTPEERKSIVEKVRAIIALLPGEWSLVNEDRFLDGNWWVVQTAREDLDPRPMIIFRPEKDRFNISGNIQVPKDYDSPWNSIKPNVEISVSQNRSSVAIADDIKKRFIPIWEDIVIEATEKFKEMFEHRSEIAKTKSRLKKHFDWNEPSFFDDLDSITLCGYTDSARIELRSYGTTCTLRLDGISLEATLRILDVLKEEKGEDL